MTLSAHFNPVVPRRLKQPQENTVLGILKNWFVDWLACFQSLHLAIILLSIMCIATLVGVLMPQEGLVEIAEIKKNYGPYYNILKAMGLFNVYSSHWFITVQVLFFFNLLLGSFQWLKPAYLAATRVCFCGPEHITVSRNRFELETTMNEKLAIKTVAKTLKNKRYTVHWNKDKTKLYAAKGNWGRLGPVIAHFGILCLLVASVYGTFTGFKAQKLVAPGNTFNIMQSEFWQPNIQQPFWQGTVPEWKIRVDDFRMDYYASDPNTVQQYYADLTILNPDDTVRTSQTISVNHPLSVDDLTIYQAAYEPTGKFFIEVNGKPQTLEANTQLQDRPVSMSPLEIEGQSDLNLIAFPFFVNDGPEITEDYMVYFVKGPQGFLGANAEGEAPKMPDTLKLRVGESGTFPNFPQLKIKYVKPEVATGLQIKKAPEVPWMYGAFLIIIIGTFICIYSQRRIWVAFEKGKLLVHFKTNKARLSFMKELQKIQRQLNEVMT